MTDATGAESWRRGLRLLEQRVAALPALLAHALAALPSATAAATAGLARVDDLIATGVGSSAAHARFFASVSTELGVRARFAPLSTFLAGPPLEAARATLVVFSQGFAPNARIPLAEAEAWRSAFVVTSTPEPTSHASGSNARRADLDERSAALRTLAARGVRVLRHAVGEEYGTLLRVSGPLVGYVAAIALARAFARMSASDRAEPEWTRTDDGEICARVAAATSRIEAEAAPLDPSMLESNLAFLASGVHVERAANLALKVLEGMLRPLPPIWDLLDFAHGPYQQIQSGAATLLALARADAAGEAALLERIETMLARDRHRLLRLRADLPGPLAILEHEALLDALVLRYVAARRVDQLAWPGKGRDGALYSIAEAASAAAPPPPVATTPTPAVAPPPPMAAPPAALLLEDLAWPEVEAALAAGTRVAILPLGSTEQHGPHLPLATDTRIARSLAERLAARLGDAIVLPALALGCASEHLAFAGTLSLEASTLEAILRDVAASLAGHGFTRLFVLTAHGGNRDALGLALAAMRAAAPELAIACPSTLPPAAILHAAGARYGVAPEAAGHHAGELETSIVAHLDARSVRWDRLAAGLLDVGPEPSTIFYPSLRAHAPDGTVGDPRGADPARAATYLDAWVDWLLAVYRREESWK